MFFAKLEYRDVDFFLFQFQFQLFTLVFKNIGKTKSWGINCDRTNLSILTKKKISRNFFSTNLSIIGGGTEDRMFSSHNLFKVVPSRIWKTWNPEPRTWPDFETMFCYKTDPKK